MPKRVYDVLYQDDSWLNETFGFADSLFGRQLSMFHTVSGFASDHESYNRIENHMIGLGLKWPFYFSVNVGEEFV